LKEFLKASYRQGVRILSSGFPDGVLFHGSLLLRKFGLGLKRVSAPAAIQRAADFFFYNLRYMRPGLVRTRLRGEPFLIQLNDPCQYDLVLGLHEPEVSEWIASCLKQGMTFLDIGPNVGYFTLLAAKCVGPSGKVVALEPDPGVLAVLQRNIEINGAGNVQVVHGAASEFCGRAKLGRARSSSYSTGLYCADAVDWIDVPRYSLDGLISELGIGAVDLVKLDVEGAELEAIEGMSEILKANRARVIVELHDRPGQTETQAVMQKLECAGYMVRPISRNHIIGEPTPRRSETVG
jgi:FkbM family methyltransferase